MTIKSITPVDSFTVVLEGTLDEITALNHHLQKHHYGHGYPSWSHNSTGNKKCCWWTDLPTEVINKIKTYLAR